MSVATPTTHIPDWDNVPDEIAIAEAQADIAAGRVIPYEEVRRWLLSWGTDHELPPPECASS